VVEAGRGGESGKEKMWYMLKRNIVRLKIYPRKMDLS